MHSPILGSLSAEKKCFLKSGPEKKQLLSPESVEFGYQDKSYEHIFTG